MGKKRLTRVGAGLLVLLLALTLPSGPARAQELETSAVSAVLMDPATGEVLFSKNPHERREPASITKIMTLLLTMEAVEEGRIRLDDKVITSENARAQSDTDGSVVFLEQGEKRSVEELLIGVAVGSGNDACIALAEHIAGSEAKFVELMNQRARELGMKDTNFVNCHGMPAENHYTSAYDVAVMSREAVKHPQLLKYTSIYEYRYRENPPLILWNTNKLLAWYEDVVDGLKTGWTEKAGYCLSATGRKNGFRLVSVVLGCPVPRSHFQEAIKLLNYGFANYTSLPVAKAGEVKATLPVLRGTARQVELVCARDLGVTISKGEEDKVSYELRLDMEQAKAPVAKGTPCGRLVAFKDGKPAGEVELVAAADVEVLGWNGLFTRVLQGWFKSAP
jgi:D-alanyl-D-alanine carboxypeptidase (penicillin-binding protein 5/6)